MTRKFLIQFSCGKMKKFSNCRNEVWIEVFIFFIFLLDYVVYGKFKVNLFDEGFMLKIG